MFLFVHYFIASIDHPSVKLGRTHKKSECDQLFFSRTDGASTYLNPKYLNSPKYLNFRISIFGPPQNAKNTNPVGAAHVRYRYTIADCAVPLQ